MYRGEGSPLRGVGGLGSPHVCHSSPRLHAFGDTPAPPPHRLGVPLRHPLIGDRPQAEWGLAGGLGPPPAPQNQSLTPLGGSPTLKVVPCRRPQSLGGGPQRCPCSPGGSLTPWPCPHQCPILPGDVPNPWVIPPTPWGRPHPPREGGPRPPGGCPHHSKLSPARVPNPWGCPHPLGGRSPTPWGGCPHHSKVSPARVLISLGLSPSS